MLQGRRVGLARLGEGRHLERAGRLERAGVQLQRTVVVRRRGRARAHPSVSDASGRSKGPKSAFPLMDRLLPAAFSLSYLGALYLHPATRVRLPSKAQPERSLRDRNHPEIIRARLLAVSLVSVASLALLPLALRCIDPSLAPLAFNAQIRRAVVLAGLDFPSNLQNTLLLPLALTGSLFAGSLWITALGKGLPGQLGWSTRRVWQESSSLAGIRNLIIVRSRFMPYRLR